MASGVGVFLSLLLLFFHSAVLAHRLQFRQNDALYLDEQAEKADEHGAMFSAGTFRIQLHKPNPELDVQIHDGEDLIASDSENEGLLIIEQASGNLNRLIEQPHSSDVPVSVQNHGKDLPMVKSATSALSQPAVDQPKAMDPKSEFSKAEIKSTKLDVSEIASDSKEIAKLETNLVPLAGWRRHFHVFHGRLYRPFHPWIPHLHMGELSHGHEMINMDGDLARIPEIPSKKKCGFHHRKHGGFYHVHFWKRGGKIDRLHHHHPYAHMWNNKEIEGKHEFGILKWLRKIFFNF